MKNRIQKKNPSTENNKIPFIFGGFNHVIGASDNLSRFTGSTPDKTSYANAMSASSFKLKHMSTVNLTP